jgi:hypothetical protein
VQISVGSGTCVIVVVFKETKMRTLVFHEVWQAQMSGDLVNVMQGGMQSHYIPRENVREVISLPSGEWKEFQEKNFHLFLDNA